jgi:hypothetical protein
VWTLLTTAGKSATNKARKSFSSLAQIRKINEPIDRAQHVIGWHELVEAKFVEKALLHHELIAHHRPNSPAAKAQENHSEGQVASTFSTKSARPGNGEMPDLSPRCAT